MIVALQVKLVLAVLPPRAQLATLQISMLQVSALNMLRKVDPSSPFFQFATSKFAACKVEHTVVR